MSGIGDEIEGWLEQDIPGHIERMIEAARFGERRDWGSRGSRWERSHISTVSENRLWDYPIALHVVEVTPVQLREVADRHERSAHDLVADAADLRSYADALEGPTPLGEVILEHLAAMGDEEIYRQTLEKEENEIAKAPGGTLAWEAIRLDLRWKLRNGGLLRVDDVREAFRTGALKDVGGVGPSSILKITLALLAEVDCRVPREPPTGPVELGGEA